MTRDCLGWDCFDTGLFRMGLFCHGTVMVWDCFDMGLFWFRTVLVWDCFSRTVLVGLFWFGTVSYCSLMSHLHYARNYWLPKTTANMRHKLQVRINRVIETSLNKRTKIRTGTKTILRRMTLPSLRAKYKIKDVEMVFEDTLLEKAKIIATEKAESRNPNNIKRHKVKPIRGDTKGNYLRRIWNNVPMHHLIMHTKNPKESFKRWSKKVYMLIFEATYQLGSLPRPPEGSDGYKQLIPLKWRLDMIGNLSHDWHERLRRTNYIQYQRYRYKEN